MVEINIMQMDFDEHGTKTGDIPVILGVYVL